MKLKLDENLGLRGQALLAERRDVPTILGDADTAAGLPGAAPGVTMLAMVHLASEHEYEWLRLPRQLVRFPIELRVPPGFRPEDPSTWPPAQGRLELIGGTLLYMPPCGGVQQEVAIDVSFVLARWARAHPGFAVGGNEAGMLLHGDVRAADVAVWRRADAGPATTELRRVPPVLAVEVAGHDEDEQVLRAKAQWYLQAGVNVVWLVLPGTREVVVVTAAGDSRHGVGDTLPRDGALPGLEPEIRDFFVQLDAQA